MVTIYNKGTVLLMAPVKTADQIFVATVQHLSQQYQEAANAV